MESTRTIGEHHVTFHNQGLCHYSNSNLDTALENFKKALALNKDYEKARSWVEKVEKEVAQIRAEKVEKVEKEVGQIMGWEGWEGGGPDYGLRRLSRKWRKEMNVKTKNDLWKRLWKRKQQPVTTSKQYWHILM